MANAGANDKHRGIYPKFNVIRVDGRGAPGQKHYGCDYWVLDLNHDPHAIAALRTYAHECGRTHPKLSRELFDKANALQVAADRAAYCDKYCEQLTPVLGPGSRYRHHEGCPYA